MKFTVYMEPIAKARARTVVHGGKVQSYTPTSTKAAEWAIRGAFMKATEGRPFYIEAEPVMLSVTFYLRRPKSLPKRKQIPTTRPDIDNLYKLVADALNAYAYYDDSQISTAIIQKRYGNPPRVGIEVMEDEE